MSITPIETKGTFDPLNLPIAHIATNNYVLFQVLNNCSTLGKRNSPEQSRLDQITDLQFDRDDKDQIFAAYSETRKLPQTNSLVYHTICQSDGNLFKTIEIIRAMSVTTQKGIETVSCVVITPTDRQNNFLINALLPERLGYDISTSGQISVVVFEDKNNTIHYRVFDRERRNYNNNYGYIDFETNSRNDIEFEPFILPNISFGKSIISVQYPQRLTIWQGKHFNLGNLQHDFPAINSGIRRHYPI